MSDQYGAIPSSISSAEAAISEREVQRSNSADFIVRNSNVNVPGKNLNRN